MNSIKSKEGGGPVNLYENDFHCMKITFSEFSEDKFRRDSYEDNSMSFGQESSFEEESSYGSSSYSNSMDGSVMEERQETDLSSQQSPTHYTTAVVSSATSYGDYSTRSSNM